MSKKYGREVNIECPNCGAIVEVLRTRNTKNNLYVTSHPEGTCPAKFSGFRTFRQSVEECEDAWSKYRKELVNAIHSN